MMAQEYLPLKRKNAQIAEVKNTSKLFRLNSAPVVASVLTIGEMEATMCMKRIGSVEQPKQSIEGRQKKRRISKWRCGVMGV
jgi:hypothetical protein